MKPEDYFNTNECDEYKDYNLESRHTLISELQAEEINVTVTGDILDVDVNYQLWRPSRARD